MMTDLVASNRRRGATSVCDKALPNLFCHEPVITKLAIHFE